MSLHLSHLKKTSALIGELAFLKENGVLAIVKVEKITLENNTLHFILKPVRGRHVGLDNLRPFSISSVFDFLSYSKGCFTCSLVGWQLETNPIKVIYLNQLITSKASIADILLGFKRQDNFYTVKKLKVISSLVLLKKSIKSGKILIINRTDFKGKAWEGEEVIVLSSDTKTVKRYMHYEGEIIISDYAPQIGFLFKEIHKIISKHVSPKYFLYSDFFKRLNLTRKLKKQKRVLLFTEIADIILTDAIDSIANDSLNKNYYREQ